MNTSITVGVTRAPAPLTAPAPAVNPAALLTDKERLTPLLKAMSREALYDLAGWSSAEADSRIKGELLAVLRTLCATAPGTILRVEFVTDPNYDDGVYWDDETIYTHRADGTVEPFDFPEKGDDGYAEVNELDERFRDLLADYSRQDHPVNGAHLIVDLASGDFDESGPHSIV